MHQRPAGKYFTYCTVIFVLLSLIACSAVETSISSLYPRVIVSYAENDAQPSVRLSLYGEVTGDAWRLESMGITHTDTGFSWSADTLEITGGKNSKTQYAGYGSFYPYENFFPAGRYTVTWYEKSGRFFSSDFSLSQQSLELPQKEETVFTVLVEDEEGRILYAGQKNSDFNSLSAIRKKYPSAVLYRKYVIKNNSRVMYLYPPVYIRNNKK